MKNWMHCFAPAAALLLAVPGVRGADEQKPEPKEKKSPMRVLSGPEGGHRPFAQRLDKMEKETVTFLGVEASPAPPALAAQLGLARGTGLVIGHVAPKSPAEGVLQQHDVLLKLDDQILIEPHQLAVLVRNHKEGDEVALTYVRAGKQATAKVKLATHEVPKVSAVFDTAVPGGRALFEYRDGKSAERFVPDEERERIDRMLSLVPRPPGAVEYFRNRRDGGFRAMSINTSNSNLSYSDDEGSLDLTMKDGVKTLVAKNTKGEELFSGPVTTPDERNALPRPVRERLEKLEGMHDVTFRTDSNFEGGETQVLPFPPREISLPDAPRSSLPAHRGAFF